MPKRLEKAKGASETKAEINEFDLLRKNSDKSEHSDHEEYKRYGDFIPDNSKKVKDSFQRELDEVASRIREQQAKRKQQQDK
ncbi:MAG TPA: hypothetical protein VL485_01780 [Ktedonobacteraceae bacterium]|jgi:hypothetical protein|nr:hypothetical protein [Ktedonobacteraceae bacterium]